MLLGELGHGVLVFTVSEKKEEDFLKISNGKFRVVKYRSLPFWCYPGERITMPYGLVIKKIKDFQPDIIHTHTPFGVGWEAILAAKLFKLPLVGTNHTFYDHYLKHINLDFHFIKKISWKFMIAYYNRCDLVLSPSKSMAESLVKYGLKRQLVVFPNLVDTELFKPALSSEEKNKLKMKLGIRGKAFIYHGRISYEKGIDQVIKAFALISKKNSNLILIIAGSGPEKENLIELVKNLNLVNNVIFTTFEHKPEFIDFLRASDVFVTACKNENMPLAVLEAMASGLPVIAVDALGLPEIVKDNINGFIVPPDNLKIMSQKMYELISSDQLLSKFSLVSRELSYNYSQSKFVQSLIQIYQKLID
jgi:glycosyltransferase involved in cell wall biosynthesis